MSKTAAFVVTAVVVAMAIAFSVTTLATSTDLWQHLTVGRAIWETHSIPTRQIWTWPTYGSPDVNASWGFRALLWPVWAAGGAWGLEAWRWVTTLVAFGFAWRAARLMGARPLIALGMVVWCALIWRQRSMVRPDTLVVVLLAAELWLLARRRLGRDSTAGLIAVMLLWANVHLSWFIGLLVLAIDTALGPWAPRPAATAAPARGRA